MDLIASALAERRCWLFHSRGERGDRRADTLVGLENEMRMRMMADSGFILQAFSTATRVWRLR
jgi:hypothetical protein